MTNYGSIGLDRAQYARYTPHPNSVHGYIDRNPAYKVAATGSAINTATKLAVSNKTAGQFLSNPIVQGPLKLLNGVMKYAIPIKHTWDAGVQAFSEANYHKAAHTFARAGGSAAGIATVGNLITAGGQALTKGNIVGKLIGYPLMFAGPLVGALVGDKVATHFADQAAKDMAPPDQLEQIQADNRALENPVDEILTSGPSFTGNPVCRCPQDNNSQPTGIVQPPPNQDYPIQYPTDPMTDVKTIPDIENMSTMDLMRSINNGDFRDMLTKELDLRQ